MKRILLTGATGFIGRQCLHLLASLGHEVHAVSIDAPKDDATAANWHQADLLDTVQSMRLMDKVQPSHLLHLAWYAEPGKYWNSTENIRWVQASLTLLQAFVQHGGQRVVVAGSSAEYDWNYGYCSERFTPLAPRTLYGTCKHALQTMLGMLARQSGLSAAWGRIFFLYGPHEHPDRLVAYVIRSLLSGQPARCSHGKQIRDWLHVQDVADAFVALLASEVTGPVNIASGQPIAIGQLANRIAARLGRKDLLQLGAVPASADEPPLLIADIRRLMEEVHWQPKYTLDTGLDQTIEWWKDHPSRW